MTPTTNARLAGSMLLLYIAAGIVAMVVFGQASEGAGTAGRLASIAGHPVHVRAAIVLTLLTVPVALVLAVALHALTRHHEPDVALLALCCRVGEGLVNTAPAVVLVALLWLGGTAATADAQDAPALHALAALLWKTRAWATTVGATLFAFGSALFSYLFLRGRSIPVPLAWLGVGASAVLMFGLPADLVGILHGPAALAMWLPMLVFELALAFWLLVKGVADPASSASAPAARARA